MDGEELSANQKAAADTPSGEAGLANTIDVPVEEYSRYVAALAAIQVDEDVRKRELRWRYMLTIVLAALAIFGFNNLSGMKGDISAQVRSELLVELRDDLEREVGEYISNNRATLVGEEITELESDLDARIALLRFFQIVETIDQGDGIKRTERDAANELLRKISVFEDIRASAEFISALETLLDSYAAADLSEHIDSIESELSEVAHASPGISITMLAHYGLRVIGEADPSDATIERFERYKSSMRRHVGIGGTIGWQMLQTFRERGACPLIEEYWHDARQMEYSDKRSILISFSQFQTWADDPVEPKTARAGILYTEFLSSYSEDVEELRRVAPELEESEGAMEELLRILGQEIE